MKYIKLFETYKTINEIKDWLDKYNVKNYTINNDLTVDVDGAVDLSDKNLTKIEVQFRNVGGNFYCFNNQLTSLEGAPSSVVGNFICFNNQLTSLEGCPSSVGGGFYCSYNQLTSLEGAPVDCMSRGKLYNKRNWKFSWDQEELDEYWEEQIENDPLIFIKLEINNKEKANKSNQISKGLYNKYKYINRADKSGLLDIKTSN